MAIQSAINVKSFNLQTEVASKLITLTREVVDNQDGTLSVVFGSSIHPKSITYELDGHGRKIGIYEQSDMDGIVPSQDQLAALYGIKVTLADGTVSYVGELLSNFADQIIAESTQIPGTITTQPINIQTILAAQS